VTRKRGQDFPGVSAFSTARDAGFASSVAEEALLSINTLVAARETLAIEGVDTAITEATQHQVDDLSTARV
jgi:hypothetical protein